MLLINVYILMSYQACQFTIVFNPFKGTGINEYIIARNGTSVELI